MIISYIWQCLELSPGISPDWLGEITWGVAVQTWVYLSLQPQYSITLNFILNCSKKKNNSLSFSVSFLLENDFSWPTYYSYEELIHFIIRRITFIYFPPQKQDIIDGELLCGIMKVLEN